MIMFLLQALLLLLVAFGLGYFLGRFLKKLFCKPEPMQRINPNETSATIHADRKPLERPSATVSTGAVAAGAAAVAATGAALAGKKLDADEKRDEPAGDMNVVDLEAPSLDVELPTVDVAPPDVDLTAPSLDVELPEVEGGVGVITAANAAALATDAGLVAEATATAGGSDTATSRLLWDDDATADLEILNSDQAVLLRPGEFHSLASVRCGVDKPGFVSVGSDVSHLAEGSAVLFPIYQVAVHRDDMERYTFVSLSAEAGVGTDAVAEAVPDATVSADTSVDAEAETDWLAPVKAVLATGNRRPSLLWDADSAYHCGLLSDYADAITLQHGHYEKLGSIHCGVTRPGALAVGGDVGYIEEGQAMLFPIYQIVVCRDEDGDHHFLRLTELL